jgi:hypothetical protein
MIRVSGPARSPGRIHMNIHSLLTLGDGEAAAFAGVLPGGPPAVRTDRKRLKPLFACPTLAAALSMAVNALPA